MRFSSRLLPLLLVLSLGVTTVVAQPASPSGISMAALQSSGPQVSPDAGPSSAVLKEDPGPTQKRVGVRAEALQQYAETDALQLDAASVRPVSFDLSSRPSAPAPQSNNGTRTTLYVIGGVLVVGGAVVGILALSGGPDPIPAPPGRPPQ